MLNVKKLQAIRDKILGVTVNERVYGDLNSTVYLQQILDALLGTNALRVRGNLNEKIYLQKIRNAARGVSDGQFGSLSNSVYLQQIINAFNGVVDGKFGSLSENSYLDALVSAAKPLTFVPTSITGLNLWIDFSDLTTLFQDDAGATPVTADAQKIGRAADKSGKANHITQPTAGNRPTYKSNIQNGKSVSRYLVATAQRLASGVVLQLPQPNTAFLVAKFDVPVDTGTYLAIDGKEAGKQEALYYLGGATKRITAFAGTNLSQTAAYTPAFLVFSALYNGNNSLCRMGGVEKAGAAGTG